MKAAELFVKSLESAGVSHVFAVPGEENLAFVEAIRNSDIKLITCRHEQSAAFMAATIGRLTGRVGVALSTLGPGATNLVTGVAYAQLGGMPLLVITGQKPIKKSKQGKFQIVDVVGMMRPITKHAETIVGADRIPSSVYQAVRMAEGERPGAVHLELPEDIAEEDSDELPIPWEKTRRPVPDEKAINALVVALEKSNHPLIIVGSGANRKLIGKQLGLFIEKTKIPFVSTQMGKGVIGEGSEFYLGTTALSSDDFVHEAIKEADLLLMVGHDINEKPPAPRSSGQKLVHINFYPADIDYVYQPFLEVIGDISNTLWQLNERIKVQTNWDLSVFKAYKNSQLTDTLESSEDLSFPMKPQKFVRDLRQVLKPDSILSLDNGMYKLWIARNYPTYEANSLLLDNALATMGAGLAAGMAAQVLDAKRQTVVVAGDGGFLMNMSDLETAVRLKLNLVIIIIDDQGYGMIKWKQQSMGLADFGLNFANPDFVKLAESFGAKGYRIDKAADFKPTLESALSKPGVHIIDLPIDYNENVKLTAQNLRKRSRS